MMSIDNILLIFLIIPFFLINSWSSFSVGNLHRCSASVLRFINNSHISESELTEEIEQKKGLSLWKAPWSWIWVYGSTDTGLGD